MAAGRGQLACRSAGHSGCKWKSITYQTGGNVITVTAVYGTGAGTGAAILYRLQSRQGINIRPHFCCLPQAKRTAKRDTAGLPERCPLDAPQIAAMQWGFLRNQPPAMRLKNEVPSIHMASYGAIPPRRTFTQTGYRASALLFTSGERYWRPQSAAGSCSHYQNPDPGPPHRKW